MQSIAGVDRPQRLDERLLTVAVFSECGFDGGCGVIGEAHSIGRIVHDDQRLEAVELHTALGERNSGREKVPCAESSSIALG